MRKISLSKQIIFLFTSIFCISTLVFSTLMLLRAEALAEAETYERLGSYVEIIDRQGALPSENILDTEEFEIAFIRGTMMISSTWPTLCSANLADFIPVYESDGETGSTYYNEIVDKVIFAQETSGFIKNDKQENIYYFTRTNNHGDFIIILTNSEYIGQMKNQVVVQSFIIFISVFVTGGALVLLWSRGIVKRINRMQKHIDELNINNYSISYSDNGYDEISELSNSIESMRLQIQKNEKTKQEMLQNVSHDFKTPIAVIKSYTEAIEDGIDTENACNIIMQQTDILKNKVNKLLQYNKLEYLQKNRDFDKVNMKELIETVAKNYRFQTNIEINLDLDEIYYYGYYENYYTVIDNILDNAKRYAKTIIKITLKPEYLIIYNDGEFIDEQFLNGLFKPYEKGSKGQFGLGMSIVVKTLNFFSMQLSIYNEEVGVSFKITK